VRSHAERSVGSLRLVRLVAIDDETASQLLAAALALW
jgi:hypothetical protein